MEVKWDRWALFRTLLLLQLYVVVPVLLAEDAPHMHSTCKSAGGEIENTVYCNLTRWKMDTFLTSAGIVAKGTCSTNREDVPSCSTSCSATPSLDIPELQRPKCEEGLGCDRPLHCFDFRSLGEESSIVPDPPRAVKVTSYQLEGILENPTIRNCCALVMFYASWCEFSAQFARKFNALGRTFDGLPALALDLGENEPHKYILAYLPVVAFYYRGKLLMRYNNLSVSYEDFREQIANMTGFAPREIDVMEEENEEPVPTVRVASDRYLLHMASLWLIFVVLVYMLKSRLLANCLGHFGSRIGRRELAFLQRD